MSIITYKRGDKTALTKNFSRYEFDCPCGCGTQMVDPELAEKLQRIRPASIGQASRISGVNPADLAILAVYIEQGKIAKVD